MADPVADFAERHQLSLALQALELAADERLIERLWIFIDLLMRWNRTYNLTGARDEATLVQAHLLDSLAAVPVLAKRIGTEAAQRSLLIDVGSGAGFPGIVIAAVNPDWPLALVEPNGKKAAFLRQALAAMKLSRVTPIATRLQSAEAALTTLMPAEATRHFTCRAVASLSTLVDWIRPHATADSRLFALKSRHISAELPHQSTVSVHSLFIPGLEQERTLVELALNSPAPPPQGALQTPR